MNNFMVEYAVQMTCDLCKKKIEDHLATLKDVTIVNINVKEQSLVVQLNDNSCSALQIQNIIEHKLGLNAIIRGVGDFVSAVSEIRGSRDYPGVIGVARFAQNQNKNCLLDAVIDGLEANKNYRIGIHENGDLSDPSLSNIGEEIFPFAKNISTDNSSKVIVKKRVDNCDLSSFIGRAFAIRFDNDKNNDQIVGAAIVARASKIMDNSKKVCACSGKTLWEERQDNR